MDPVSLSLLSTVRALQALPTEAWPVSEVQLLAAFVGQDMEGVLEALLPGGARIRLEAGPTVEAKGQVPFSEGTKLTVRVTQTEQGIRLQTLEARPPAPPAVLAPLFQGEAFTLLSRLFQADAPPALVPLQQLLETLVPLPAQPPPQPQPSSPAGQGTAAPAPTPGMAAPPMEPAQVAPLIAHLPPPIQTALAHMLSLPVEASPQNLAEALVKALGWDAPTETSSSPQGPVHSVPVPPSQESKPPQAMMDPLTRFQSLLAKQPALPQDVRDGLLAFVRQVLPKPQLAAAMLPAGSSSMPGMRAPAQPELPVQTASGTPPQKVPEAPQPSLLMASAPLADVSKGLAPASVEAWMREGLRVLSDPTVSPREAPFHVLQAQEKTAFFELPMPWAPQHPLQLWVEWEGEKEQASTAPHAVVRVLIGTRFSRLGETRVGFERGSGYLAVRVWTEHPELLGPVLDDLRQELSNEGRRVDLQILPLSPKAPSLRELTVGEAWQGLG